MKKSFFEGKVFFSSIICLCMLSSIFSACKKNQKESEEISSETKYYSQTIVLNKNKAQADKATFNTENAGASGTDSSGTVPASSGSVRDSLNSKAVSGSAAAGLKAGRAGSANSRPGTEKKYPQKIVALSPASTEILCSIGALDQIAARSDYSDYPPEVLSKPVAGGFDGKNLSVENILSFSPDLVYLTSGMHDYLIPLLRSKKIPYFISMDASVKGILSEIKEIGKITGHEKQAEVKIAEIQAKILELKKSAPKRPKSVYWEIWSPPYMSIGKNSFINELIQIAGGKNIFDDIKEAYPIVSDEQILLRNPDVIIIPDNLQDGIEGIKIRNGWKNIEAVKNGSIYSLDADMISRPSPRITEAIAMIQKCLLADQLAGGVSDKLADQADSSTQ